MSAQDLEQRALELLPELPPMAMTVAGDDPDAGHWYRAEQMRDYAASAVAAALRQQPAPVDLEQFREAVAALRDQFEAEAKSISKGNGSAWSLMQVRDWRDEADRLLSIIDNAHQPAPVVDDARMARALEWVRVMAMQDADGSHVSAIQEAIAAYDPNCGARTVRVVDGALLRWVKAQADDENANPRFRELYDALAQGVQS